MQPENAPDTAKPESDPAGGDGAAIARLAAMLSDPKFPTGDHAALRRMSPLAPGRAALALERALIGANVTVYGMEDARRWALIVHSLALARGRHDRGEPTGRKLFEIGLTEARLNQLLSADADTLFDLLPRLARRLAGQPANIDWLPLAQLARRVGVYEDRADETRLKIARDYARAQAAKEKAA